MIKASLYQLHIPLKKSFDHAKKTRKMADSILLKIEHKGIVGWGECAPRDYVTGENSSHVFKELVHAKPKIFEMLHKKNCCEPFLFFDELSRLTQFLSPNSRCILEMAVLDWFGRFYKKPVFKLLTDYFFYSPVLRKDNCFKTSQVLDLSMSARHFLETRYPFHCIKIKANTDITLTTKRVQVIRDVVGYDIPLIIDANMSWGFDDAIEKIAELEKYNIAFFEEPLKKGLLYEYGLLRKKTKAKILLDESLCSYEDALNAIKYKAVDAFNIRISKCGGLLSSIKLIELARKNGISFQLGAQVAEIGPLISAARHLRTVVTDAFTFEAGQPDYLFQDYLFNPMPLVDRNTNLAYSTTAAGLGIDSCNIPEQMILNSAEFHENQWGASCLA